MPVYILTLSKICPGEPTGFIGDLFEDAFTNQKEAEQSFNGLALSSLYFRKELWLREKNGRRKLLKEERYAHEYAENAG